MKISDVRQKTNDDLRTQVKKIHDEHYNLRFRRVTDVIENPRQLRELRKDLARIHTVIRERELESAAKTPAAPAAAAPAAPSADNKAAPATKAKPAAKKASKAKPEAKAKPAKKAGQSK
jgi:large subunit ribosomal protein L29